MHWCLLEFGAYICAKLGERNLCKICKLVLTLYTKAYKIFPKKIGLSFTNSFHELCESNVLKDKIDKNNEILIHLHSKYFKNHPCCFKSPFAIDARNVENNSH